MAKPINVLLLDESEKNQKKINRMLEGNKISQLTVTNFEQMKSEVARGEFTDFSKIKIMITSSYLVYYNMILGYFFEIIPLNMIVNAYRTNMCNGEYDYNNFNLAVELTDSSVGYISTYIKTDKNYDVYEPVITELKVRAENWSRGK